MNNRIKALLTVRRTALLSILALISILMVTPVFAGQLVINSLPYTVNQSSHSADSWDTITVAGTKLTSATDGIEFIACYNWVLNLGADTLVFGQGSSSAQWNSIGIDFRPYGYDGCHDIIVKGGYIINNPLGIDTLNYDPADTLSGRCDGIRMGFASHDLTIDGSFIRIAAYSSHAIMAGGARGQLIKNVVIDHAGPGFHNRGSFDACAIKGVNWNTDDLNGPNDYHIRIEGSKVIRCPHNGFYFNANQTGDNYVVGQIEACTLTVDSRNIMYYPVGDGQTEHGRANCYAIQFTRAGPNTYIKHCVINSGTAHHGGRGIQFVVSKGTETEPVQVDSNYVSVHEAADVAFTGIYGYYPCAMKIRQNCRGIHVFDNTLIYTSDGSIPWGTVTGSYYCSGHAFVYQYWTESPSPPYYITVENNLMRAIDRNPSGGALLDGVIFDWKIGYDPSFVWRNNRIESDYVGYRWGGYDGPANATTIIGDTLKLVDTSNSNHYAFQLGYLQMNYDAEDIIVQDMAYENSLGNPADYDQSINFPSSSGSADITEKRTIDIYARGTNDLPVTGASVTVTNNYGQTVLTGTTNSGGKVSGVVSYRYESRTGTDSTNYNNFTINVSKSSDNAQGSLTVKWNQYKDTVDLSSTSGDGTWDDDEPTEDVTPPSTINDLSMSPGTARGSALLSWSTPGDDGNSGQASYYIIKYSLYPITSSNWSSATIVSGPPSPADPSVHSTQSFTISGLNPGYQYYAAIMTYDEAGNGSGVSNDPRGYARGIVAPVTDSASLNTTDSLVTLFSGPVESYLTVDYQFALDVDNGFSDPILETGVENGGNIYAVYDDLLENTNYYWRCRAISDNLSDTSNWSTVRNFLIVDFSSDIDEEEDPQGGFAPLAPLSSASLNISHPTLVISNLNEDPNTYRFEISTDSSDWNNLSAVSSDIEQGDNGKTIWRVDDRLSSGRYFWRAQVNGALYSSTAHFEILPNSHVFPNPFRPYETSYVTFVDIPINHNVTISSVSGTIVKTLAGNAEGNDIIWDGTNESNNPVSSGVYLWFIEGTELHGKLIVIR
jgi:hypothetical protein